MSLTRGGTAIVLLVAFSLSVASSTNATIYIAVSCLISLLVLNAVLAFRSVRGLTLSREHPSHIMEDSDMTVRLCVFNHSRNARTLLRLFDWGPDGRNRVPAQITMLAGGESETVSYSRGSGKRGVHNFAGCSIETSFPFGLINARRFVSADSQFVAYPVYYELAGAIFPFHKTYSGMTTAPGFRPGEGPSFFGLREYREGDPLRKIHWPTTVRARTVIVKEFEEDMHNSMTILLDTFKPAIAASGADTNLEAAIRATASLANYALAASHPVSLSFFDGTSNTPMLVRSTGDMTSVLDALARLKPSGIPPAELIAKCGTSASRRSNWIVLLLRTDREAMTRLLQARSQGAEIVVVATDPEDVLCADSRPEWMPALLDLFETAGINIVHIRPGDNIQACLSRNLRPRRRVSFPTPNAPLQPAFGDTGT